MSPVPGFHTPKVPIVWVWAGEPSVEATSTVSTRYSVRTKPVMLVKVVAEHLRLWGARIVIRSSVWWYGAGDAAAWEASSRPERKNEARTIVSIWYARNWEPREADDGEEETENRSLPRDLLEHAEKKRRRHRILYLAPAEYCPVRNVPVEIRVRGRNLHRINCDLVNLGL